MKYSPTLITNIGLIIFFGILVVDKLSTPTNQVIITWGYAIGGILVLWGTVGYFMRKK